MKYFGLLLISVFFLICRSLSAGDLSSERGSAKAQNQAEPMLQCVAFSPYVGELNPDYGAHPSARLINELLDKIVNETPFRCIMTYGVLNGLDAVFPAAESRKLKVIAILWIDKDKEVNSQSIAKGIEVARAYPDTVIRLSCGSEVRTRHGYQFDSEIIRCIDALREARVTQPVTTIDIWWEWCNRATPCRKTLFSDKVDWIGINIFPWWENKHAGVHTCTTAEQAAVFHVDRLKEVSDAHPGKEVILTEFGWPNGPDGATEVNVHTGEHCGIASRENQTKVIESTLKKLSEENRSGVVFEAFSEEWKSGGEGQTGAWWGICGGKPPYACGAEWRAQAK